MKLSCIVRQSSILPNALRVPRSQLRVAQSPLVRFASCTRHSSSQSARRNASLRPITLFAICIPLGYGLNWALKERRNDGEVDKDGFVKYSLISKEDVSSICSIFTLKPAGGSAIRTDDPAFARAVTSVQFKQPQLQIARSYTLLPPTSSGSGADPHSLRFLIRKEKNGEVSGYLHRLPLGAEIEVRGLQAEYVLPEKVDKVVFLAGGTGIAPALQVAGILAAGGRVGEGDVHLDMHILWANRRREDCVGGRSGVGFGWWRSFGFLSASEDTGKATEQAQEQERGAIVSQLDSLKKHAASSTVSVDYFVDEEATFITTGNVEQAIASTTRSSSESGLGRKLLFVAGPDGFINHWAGNKEWVNGQEVQGPLGGVLNTLDLKEWKVVKL